MKPDAVAMNSAQGRVGLRILATSDIHGHLRAFNYQSGREDPSVGLSRAASVISRLRATARNSLLVDCGDFLLGGALDQEGTPTQSPPIMAAMNALGYDAAAIGNHEFDQGIPSMMQAFAHGHFPVLSANAVTRLGRTPLHDQHLTSAYHMHELLATDDRGRPHPLRIGIIGLTPPIEPAPMRDAEAVVIRGIVETARHWIPELRRLGADVIVALCHSGIPERPDDTDNVATELAELGGIDALVLGHRHKVFPGPDHQRAPGVDPIRGRIAGTPAVMPGCWGRQVGAIDLSLSRSGDDWVVVHQTARCHGIAERQPDGSLRALVSCAPSILRATESAHVTRIGTDDDIVGHSPRALHTFFSRLGFCPVTQLIGCAQKDAVERALASTPYADLPVVGIAAPVRSGGLGGPENYTDIPAGPIMAHRLTDLYPYPNRVVGLKITGARLREWLERSVSGFATIAPGEALPRLTDPGFPGFDFDMGYDLEVLIDLTRRPCFDAWGNRTDERQRGRVAELKRGGEPVRDHDEIVVAVNEYRGSGGGNFPGASPDGFVVATEENVRGIVRSYLERGAFPAEPAQTFRFAPVRDALICCESGPGALRHMADVSFLPLDHVGSLPTGFHAFALDLDKL